MATQTEESAQNLKDQKAIIIKVHSFALQHFSYFSKIASTVIYVISGSVVTERNSCYGKFTALNNLVVSTILHMATEEKETRNYGLMKR